MLFRNPTALILLLGATVGCAEEEPETRGLSRYIELVGWTDFTPCGATLPQQDVFLEAVFTALEEPVPNDRFIQLLWFTRADEEEHPDYWPCDPTRRACAFDRPPLALVASRVIEHRHELVHAVHYAALGPSHSLLHEGLASYYGDPFLDMNIDQAAYGAELDEILESMADSPVDDYPVARRFVGATIERHGMTLFKTFWANTPPDSTASEFRSAYESTYSETFTDAVEAIKSHKTVGQPLDRCTEEPRPWTTEDLFEMELGGSCDDSQSYGPLDVDPTIFEQRFVVELPVDGYYEVATVGSSLEGSSLIGSSCAGVAEPQTIYVSADTPTLVELPAGRYLMSVGLRELEPDDSVSVRIIRHPAP